MGAAPTPAGMMFCRCCSTIRGLFNVHTPRSHPPPGSCHPVQFSHGHLQHCAQLIVSMASWRCPMIRNTYHTIVLEYPLLCKALRPIPHLPAPTTLLNNTTAISFICASGSIQNYF
eukprot:6185060-Pleurochrysis_carterae.AAC.1